MGGNAANSIVECSLLVRGVLLSNIAFIVVPLHCRMFVLLVQRKLTENKENRPQKYFVSRIDKETVLIDADTVFSKNRR